MTLIGGQVLAGDAGAAGRVVVLQHPVEGRVRTDDHQAGAGREVDQLGAGGGTLLDRAADHGRAAGDDAVDVRAVAAEREGVGVDAGRDLLDGAGGLGRLTERLVAGHDGAAAVGLLEVRVRRVDAGVDDPDGDALAGQLAAIGAGHRLGGLETAGRLVGGLGEEADRLLAGLDVRHARLAADRLDLGLGAARSDHADLLERDDLGQAGGGDGLGRVGEGRAVDQDGGPAGERGQLLGEVRRDAGQLGRGGRGVGRGQAERDEDGRTGGHGREEAWTHAPTTTDSSPGYVLRPARAARLTTASGSSAE